MSAVHEVIFEQDDIGRVRKVIIDGRELEVTYAALIQEVSEVPMVYIGFPGAVEIVKEVT